jgi:hypothetical protein
MAKGCNNTGNLLTLPLALRRGRHKPLTITGGGQEQSPTLANASKLLQAVYVAATTKRNKNPVANQPQSANYMQSHNANTLGSLNLTSNIQRSKRD